MLDRRVLSVTTVISVFPLVLLTLGLGFAPAAAAQEVPTPGQVIGFRPGDDFKLADWKQIQEYCRALDTASVRVRVESIGQTTLGKPMLLLIASGEANMQRLEEIRQGVARLSDPRGLEPIEAERLARSLPVVLLVGCAQHASEIASTQMSMELAYRVATDPSAEMEEIRRRVVLLIIPSLNPDGHQMVCDWYQKHLGGPFEGGRMPWLYHHYVGHDINRDWAMLTQAETTNVSTVLYREWKPQVLIDVHQMGRGGARMFIPPYYDPINPNMDPLIQHQLSLIGAQMQLDLSRAGLKGVITSAMFDEWLLGYFTSVPCRHNVTAQLIEMASVNIASPVFQRRSELQVDRGDGDYGPRANFPEPWEGGWWRLRDIVDYELTAISSVLGLAARNSSSFLSNFYELSRRQVEAGLTEPPYAYIVPPAQPDPATAWRMLVTLHKGGIEIDRAREAFVADGVTYPAGSWVVLMAQPYRAHAKDMLEKQVYPSLRVYPGGPPARPYDVTGWTLPLLMGVKTIEAIGSFAADLELVTDWEEFPRGSIHKLDEDGDRLLVERTQNNAYVLVNRLLSAGGRVESLEEPVEIGEHRFSSGTFVISLTGGENDLIEEARQLGLDAYRAAAPSAETLRQVPALRTALYQPWTSSIDEGWTRWVLEQFEFDYQTLHDAEVRAGELHERYDVIVLPGLSGRSIVRGVSADSIPRRYAGGIGEEGVFALRDFVRGGGTLIALDSACPFVIESLDLPVTMAPTRDDESEEIFSCPGSVLWIEVDPDQSLGYGLPRALPIMFSSSPVMELKREKGTEDEGDETPGDRPIVVGSYPRVNPLMSGWIENDKFIRGKAALIDAPFGSGDAVLIGFPCQFRAQPHGTFKVLFNAILTANPAGS